MADIIDKLAVEISAEDGFSDIAEKILKRLEELEKGVGSVDKTVGKSNKSLNSNGDELKKLNKSQRDTAKEAKNISDAFGGLQKVLVNVGALILSGLGFNSLVREITKVNVELYNTSKNLGISAKSLQNWRGAAEMAGGSADGMTGYLNSLAGGISRLTVMGDTSVLPAFSALNVALLDGKGNARDLSEIMLDLSDAMSSIDRVKARSISQQMGMDEGTFNLLIKGRAAVENYLKSQSKIYRSNEADLKTSQKLTESTAKLNQQFNALKVMIANAVAPLLTKVAEIATRFFDYLNRNENIVKGVFYAIGTALTVGLIPAFLQLFSVAVKALGPFAPIVGTVALLSAAFGALYDDYKKWSNGGKSLFNWEKFSKLINESNISVDSLAKGLLYLATGHKSLTDLLASGKGWAEMKGFIDENGVSLETLGTGFKNLAKDIYDNVITALAELGEILKALGRGDFSVAWDLAIKFARKNNPLGVFLDRGAEAVDTMLGVDPNSPNSVSNMKGSLLPITDDAISFAKNSTMGKKFAGFGEDVDRFIAEGAEMFGQDEKTMRGFAKKEGGWKNQVSNTGPAGVGQFAIATWNDLVDTEGGRKIGMVRIPESARGTSADQRFNKEINAKAMALYTSMNTKKLRDAGIEITPENQYLAHNIGAGGLIRTKRGNPNDGDVKNMIKNGMKSGESPQDFIKRQGADFMRHYAEANNTYINPNQPILGSQSGHYGALAGQQLAAMINNARQGPSVNNQKTDVVVNGVTINTSSPTMTGTGADMATGIQQRYNAMQFNTGLN